MGFNEKRKSTRVRNKALSILLCSSLILTSFSTVFASNGAVKSKAFEAKDNLCASLRITDTKQSYKTELGDVKLDMSKGIDGKISILTEIISHRHSKIHSKR